jgi:DNA polymerase III subunit alpha
VFQGGAAEGGGRAATVLPDIPEWSSTEKLKREKEALDFYVSSHPLALYEDVIRRYSPHSVGRLGELGANQEVILGGMLTELRYMNTKKARNGNSRYLRCKLEDFTGAVECVMWPDDLVRFKDEVVEDRPCFVQGTIDRSREPPGLILTRIMSIDQAQKELTRSLWLSLTLGVHSGEHLEGIARLLKRAPGPCPVFLVLQDAAGKRSVLKCGQDYSINPARLVAAELEMLLGAGRVAFAGAGTINGSNGNGRSHEP